MQQVKTTRSRSSCNWAKIKAQRSPRRLRAPPGHSTPNPTYIVVLPALIAAHHSAATIAFCLGVTVEWILDQATVFGLSSPSAQPMRRPGGRNPWTAEQIQQLILLWPSNLFATCVGKCVQRSAASVRYKARWLGLPVHQRSKLTRAIPDTCSAKPTVRERDPWTVELGHQVGFRYLRGQHVAGIALDLGRGFTSVSSHTSQIGLVGRHSMGSQLKMDHDPADAVLEKFVEEEWVYRQCNFNPNLWFWARRMGERTSPASKKSKAYKDRLASGDDSSDGDFFDE